MEKSKNISRIKIIVLWVSESECFIVSAEEISHNGWSQTLSHKMIKMFRMFFGHFRWKGIKIIWNLQNSLQKKSYDWGNFWFKNLIFLQLSSNTRTSLSQFRGGHFRGLSFSCAYIFFDRVSKNSWTRPPLPSWSRVIRDLI